MPVKGPRIDRVVVRPVRTGRDLLLVLCILVMIAATGFLGWHAGRDSILSLFADEDAEGSDASLRLEKLLEDNRALREQVDVHRGSAELSSEVEKKIRSENLVLQTRITELEEAVGYYRRVAMPDRSGKGLHIERFELLPGEKTHEWVLRLVLIRTGETDAFVEGRIDGTLHVNGQGGRRLIPLDTLLDQQARQFRTRYVEEMKARFVLPGDARPERLDLVMDIQAPRKARIERVWKSQAQPPP